jgi:hypothetical protein
MPPHQGRESILIPPANEPAEQFRIGFGIGGAHQTVELVQQLRMACRHEPFLGLFPKLFY